MTIDFVERFDIPSGTAQTRGHGANGRTWKSPSHRKAAAAWQALFELHKPGKPLSVAVCVFVILLYHNGKAGMAARPKTTRPDLDNLAKVFTDALMSAGIVAEDKLVWCLHVEKREWCGHEMVHFHLETEENPQKTARNREKTAKNPQK